MSEWSHDRSIKCSTSSCTPCNKTSLNRVYGCPKIWSECIYRPTKPRSPFNWVTNKHVFRDCSLNQHQRSKHINMDRPGSDTRSLKAMRLYFLTRIYTMIYRSRERAENQTTCTDPLTDSHLQLTFTTICAIWLVHTPQKNKHLTEDVNVNLMLVRIQNVAKCSFSPQMLL